MATKKTKPKTEQKVESKEIVEEAVKVAEIEEKSDAERFFERKLKAINKLNNPAKAKRYADKLFQAKRGIK